MPFAFPRIVTFLTPVISRRSGKIVSFPIISLIVFVQINVIQRSELIGKFILGREGVGHSSLA